LRLLFCGCGFAAGDSGSGFTLSTEFWVAFAVGFA